MHGFQRNLSPTSILLDLRAREILASAAAIRVRGRREVTAKFGDGFAGVGPKVDTGS